MNQYYKKIINFSINKIILCISVFVRKWERNKIKKYSVIKLKHQPIFIVGAPRTGSTMLYQILTNQLDILYIDNLICKFNKNLFFGFWLSNMVFKQRAHNCFQSDYGDTSKYGLHSPSECGAFWYKWLPKDRHFVDYDDITDDVVREIREEIIAVINYFDKPLLFKNLNAGQRLRLLSKCFPEAKIIFLKRETIFTAQSILNAKRKIGIKDNVFWSVKPRNYENLKKMNSYEQIIKQIYSLEKQIVNDSKLLNEKSFMTLDYKKIINEFEKILRKCQKLINAKKKKNFQKAEIKLTEVLMLKSEEVDKLNFEIQKLDWVNYND